VSPDEDIYGTGHFSFYVADEGGHAISLSRDVLDIHEDSLLASGSGRDVGGWQLHLESAICGPPAQDGKATSAAVVAVESAADDSSMFTGDDGDEDIYGTGHFSFYVADEGGHAISLSRDVLDIHEDSLLASGSRRDVGGWQLHLESAICYHMCKTFHFSISLEFCK
ncbi:Alpha-glucosidase 2, partial [Bienertia sinuspersici]